MRKTSSQGPGSTVRYCARDFSSVDLADIQRIIASQPTRAAAARAVCEHLGWYKPGGGLKASSCALALRRMQTDGLIQLPAPAHPPVRRAGPPPITSASDPQPPVTGTRRDLGVLELRRVRGATDSRLWNELIQRYHYVGYRRLAGAQLRFLVYANGRLVAALGFGASAWRIYDRDAFIGWDDDQRIARLHLVVNLSRFLIFPWVQVKFLASSLLAQSARALPRLWIQAYGYQPLLLESFVECDRFRATSFRAANWRYVGETMGRGKLDRLHNRPVTTFKSIWLYPLQPRFRSVLCAPLPSGGWD